MSEFHNLDIHMYSLTELLDLFGLTHDISMEDLKRAKKKVLMSHPDKSKLDAKYFLFYKKAFEVIVQFYDNQNKHKKMQRNDTEYDSSSHNHLDNSNTKEVSSKINKIPTKDFQTQFNKLFDENMTTKIDQSKNDWFTSNENNYEIAENVNSKNMGEVLNKIKENQSSMVQYNGVQNLYVNGNSGNSLYEKDDGAYVTTDPFSKLKFDDLRKVHKDETVFSVSEKDIHKVPQYASVDQFVRARGKQAVSPMEKQEAERILATQNETYRQQIMQKEYDDKLKTMKNAEKNKGILSKFLFLKNE
tara:strand:- start:2226 stop:3131 length:906 start_codon:yes stop_codon:yes gene_type:complete